MPLVAKKNTTPDDRPRGRPPVESPKRRAINARLPDPLADALDAYLASLRPAPTATAVVLLSLEEFLIRAGFPPKTPPR